MSLSAFAVRVASWGGLGQTNAERLLAFAKPLLDDNTTEVLNQIAESHPGAQPQSFDFIAPALRVAGDFAVDDLYAYRLPAPKGTYWEVGMVWALTEPMGEDVCMLAEDQNGENPAIPDDLRPATDIAAESRGIVTLERSNGEQDHLPASWPNLHPLELHTALQYAPNYSNSARPRDVTLAGIGHFGLSLYDPLSQNEAFKALSNDALLNYGLVGIDPR